MQQIKITVITASQLLAMLIYAAQNGTESNPLALDFCLRKSQNSASRSRASTKYEVLINLPWLGNGGVFLLVDESGNVSNFKFEQFGRWLAKLGSGTLGVVVQTKITLLDLSDLGRPMTGSAGANALVAFQNWAGGDKLTAEIIKAEETLTGWGVELVDDESGISPPYPPNYSNWWQTVSDSADLGFDVAIISTGEAADLGDSGAVKGIFEAAKGGRSTRTSDKKITLAKKMAIMRGVEYAQQAAKSVVEHQYLGYFDTAIGYSDSGNNDENGGGAPA